VSGDPDPLRPAIPARVPGRYFVYALVAFVVLFLGTLTAVAVWLTPVADRVRTGAPPTQPK
jgi:hypothetical protein